MICFRYLIFLNKKYNGEIRIFEAGDYSQYSFLFIDSSRENENEYEGEITIKIFHSCESNEIETDLVGRCCP